MISNVCTFFRKHCGDFSRRAIVRALPAAEEIYNSIPDEGISIQGLASKFHSNIDPSNARLFSRLVEALGRFESKLRVVRVTQMPTPEQIDNILQEAKRPAPPKPRLAPQERQEFSSELLDPIVYGSSQPLLTLD